MNKYTNPDIRCTLDPNIDGYCWSYKQYIDKGEEFLKLETVKRCKRIKSMQDICLHCMYWVR